MCGTEANHPVVSSSLLLRSEVPDYPLSTAFVLDDKSVFLESKFEEIFTFFKKLCQHFYFLQGVKEYLVPAITTPEEYDEVEKIMPRFGIYASILSKYERSFLSAYNKGKPEVLEKVLSGIVNEMERPYQYMVKKSRKINYYQGVSKNHSLDHLSKLIQCDEDLLEILPRCHIHQSYENARCGWYHNVIVGERNEKEVSTRQKLIQKISETNHEDIRLAALFSLKY